MNPSRLAELERQRALVREQLAWLEREIARESSTTPPTTGAVALIRPPSNENASRLAPYERGPALASETPATAHTDAYEPDPKNAAQSARRGCLFAAGAVFVLLIAGFLTVYFVRYSDRPMLLPSRSDDAVKK